MVPPSAICHLPASAISTPLLAGGADWWYGVVARLLCFGRARTTTARYTKETCSTPHGMMVGAIPVLVS